MVAAPHCLLVQRWATNRGHSTIKENRISSHLVSVLLTALAVVGSGYATEMKTKPIFSSMVTSKSQPCFGWRAQRHQRILYTHTLLAENSIENEARLPSMYQRLNSPKNILAPMVAQSDLPFRLMCEHLYNVDLSYTQMIHAFNFIKPGCDTFRTNHLDVYPHSTIQDILLGKHDRNNLIVTPSQTYAMKDLDPYDIEKARSRILSAIAKQKRVQVVSKVTIDNKPTIVQIATHDPDVAVKAAMAILERSGSICPLNPGDMSTVAGIDLNLGELK